MTTKKVTDETKTCPAQGLLKLLSGKWKPEIFRLAAEQPLRFSRLLLRELEEVGLLEKVVIKQKPLHIEYYLTEKGKLLTPVFLQLEFLS